MNAHEQEEELQEKFAHERCDICGKVIVPGDEFVYAEVMIDAVLKQKKKGEFVVESAESEALVVICLDCALQKGVDVPSRVYEEVDITVCSSCGREIKDGEPRIVFSLTRAKLGEDGLYIPVDEASVYTGVLCQGCASDQEKERQQIERLLNMTGYGDLFSIEERGELPQFFLDIDINSLPE